MNPHLFALSASAAAAALRCGACVSLVAVLGVAQTTRQIVPAGTEAVDGASVEPFLVGGFEGRTEVLIRRSQLGSLATQPIRRIILRRDAQTNDDLPAGMKGGWIDLVVVASWTPRDPRSPSASFAANHGSAPAVVYRGPYRVIDSPRLPRGTKVASLAPTVSPHIVLQTPIRPAKTGNLCLELRFRQHATRAAPTIWLLDAVQVKLPPTRVSGRSCWQRGKQNPAAAKILGSAAVGASMTLTARGPLGAPALAVLGASDKQWGPIALPLDLTGFGAPGCLLYVSQDLRFLARMEQRPQLPFALGTQELQIPLDARLVGAALHSQWLFFQSGANALGITTTNAASVLIPAVPVRLGVAMIRRLLPNAATGRVYLDRAPVLVLAAR